MVRNDINSHLLDYDCVTDIEALCVQVKYNNTEFCIANFYRRNVADVSVLKSYEVVFRLLTEKKVPIVIAGDFNLPDINWNIPHASTNFSQDKFLEAFLSHGFSAESPTSY